MNKTKLEQLTKAIIKSVPEIMGLEWGCRVEGKLWKKDKKTEYIIIDSDWRDATKEEGWSYTLRQRHLNHQPHFTRTEKELKNFKIIGRDITLEDVFITIENVSISFRYFYKEKLYIQIEKNGKLLGIWQLNKPLQNQSDETINFLHDLIFIK